MAAAKTPPALGSALGFYGLAWSVYSTVISRGNKATFQPNVAMAIRLTLSPSDTIATATKPIVFSLLETIHGTNRNSFKTKRGFSLFHPSVRPLALWLCFSCALAAAVYAQHTHADAKSPVPPLEESGFHSIFDGKTLAGWDCDPDFWRVSDGSMVGQTNQAHQPKQNTFCIWKGDQPGDFELRAEYRLTGVNDGNSGIQYRSVELPQVARWVMKGYQADIDLKQQYTGQVYEERNRGFLALRGQISYVPNGQKAGSIGSVGENEQLRSFIKDDDWNAIDIIARGDTLIQLINGHVMSILIDDDPANRKMSGEIGIQLHRLPNCAMKIETRVIRIKTF